MWYQEHRKAFLGFDENNLLRNTKYTKVHKGPSGPE